MKIVLFGSPYNPLSGIAAKVLYDRGELVLVVLPCVKTYLFSEGIIHGLSMYAIGIIRLLHIIMRKCGAKTGDSYSSLKEFLAVHRNIKTVIFSSDVDELQAKIANETRSFISDEIRAVSCIFPSKIPVPIPIFKQMINIHPGLIPENRGPNPYFWVLVEKKEAAISCHVLSNQMDKGDILLKDTFTFPENSSEYGLEALTAKRLPYFLSRLFDGFDGYWLNRMPQGKGMYHRNPSINDRVRNNRRSAIRWCDLLKLWR
jgi:methionyl-tRNA formyltransferase